MGFTPESSFGRCVPTERALLYCAGGGLGDSLVASLVARALHQRFATVDALTLPAHAPLLERIPDIDDVLVDDGDEDRALAAVLADRGYDAVVVTWATRRTARVAQLAGIPLRVGQARRFYSFRFTHRVVVRSECGDVTSHWSDILLDFARAIECDTSDRHYRIVPTPRDDRAAGELCGDRERFVLLAPCNAVAATRRLWPRSGWATLARGLQATLRARVLVSGAPAEGSIADDVVRLAESSDVVSIAGRTGVGVFAALARRAAAFVGITTGAMHVAAAAGCPTVGIFPFQSDFPERWSPLGRRTSVVRPSYPCHHGDTKERCPDYACIAHLDVPRILAATASLLR